MTMIMTGIIDYSGQAHCMEHAPTVSSYQFEVYEGEARECWCGRDLSIPNLTPWDAKAEEERAEDDFFGSAPEVYDVTEFTPLCPDVLKGCAHTMVQSEEGYSVGCFEHIESQCPKGYRPVFADGEWRWIELTTEDVAVQAVIDSKAITQGSVVDVPGLGRGVVADVDRAYGECLVRFYVTPVDGGWLDTEHGRWFPMGQVSFHGFDREAQVWYANRTCRAGDTLR